jgi:signal transduction histidine kinase
MAAGERARAIPGWRLIMHSLSGRLLLLTALFVMVSVAIIYFPSVARYHHQLLEDRVHAAELAILPLTETPGMQLSRQLRTELLRRAGVEAVILTGGGTHQLFLVGEEPPSFGATFDAQNTDLIDQSGDVLRALFAERGRLVRIRAPTQIAAGTQIAVIAREDPIRDTLFDFSWRVLSLALFISGLTSALVFLVLYLWIVQPLKRMTATMTTFRENPEDARHVLRSSLRRDEIGTAEREFAAMQRALLAFLQQRAHLAALGSAVAKIQHDLRNILASAQIASDRLSTVDDPVVKGQTTRLMVSLDRAVALATTTLRYGKAEERQPERARFALAPLVNEVAESAIPEGSRVAFECAIEGDIMVDADREHLFRVMLNLIRNAREALEASTVEAPLIRVEGRRKSDSVMILVIDNGPGIPEKARERLFLPFGASGRPGGSGLGLAIARELMHMHGGEVELVRTGPEGTRFRVTIPDRTER